VNNCAGILDLALRCKRFAGMSSEPISPRLANDVTTSTNTYHPRIA
jgi:hypothetical protein